MARRVRRDELNEPEYQTYASDYQHEVSFELEYAIFPQFAAFSDSRIKAILSSTKQTATALAEDDDAAENFRQAILNAKPVYIDA